MSNKKLQVFVSSTFEDLKEERQAAVEAILSAGHIPAGMELFTAGDETQIKVIQRWIDDSDVYLLILGGRYGSVEKVSGKSYTQLEYEYAVEKGKALFAVVIIDEALQTKVSVHGLKMIEQQNSKEFNLFKEEVKTGKVVKFWKDAKDIQLCIFQTLFEFSYRKELTGWVRGDNAINTGVVAEELARLGKENEEMKSILNKADNNVLYAGLSYSQLKKILQNEKIVIGAYKENLFEFILKYGRYFGVPFNVHWFLISEFPINEHDMTVAEDVTESLLIFRLIEQLDNDHYTLTDNSYNFYLKALALQNEEFNR